jgi:hypothetical protein
MADFAALFEFGGQFLKLFNSAAESNDAAKRSAMLVEFNQALFKYSAILVAIQQENSTLIRDKRDLEEKIVRMETWNTEKQRYAIARPHYVATVYALRRAASNGEQPHYICTNCYENGKRSILNVQQGKSHWDYCCPAPSCKATFAANNLLMMPGAAKYAEDIEPV